MGIGEQSSQQAASLGQMADDGCLLLGQPDVQELLERVALGVDDAHRPVLCADQFGRSLDDAAEDEGEIALLQHRLCGAEQGAESSLGAQDALTLRYE